MEVNNLRSRNWFAREGKDGIIYRAWMKNQGIPDEEFRGKPVIGICNTWSELTPCNANITQELNFVRSKASRTLVHNSSILINYIFLYNLQNVSAEIHFQNNYPKFSSPISN